MRAYKFKGKIAKSGQLILTEPINLTPGEVEVIILQPTTETQDYCLTASASNNKISQKSVKSRSKSLQQLLETAPAITPNFDSEQARWDTLKEKYDL